MIRTLTISLITAFQQQQPEMADALRSNGKIYVVVGVVLIVLTGIFILLFVTEKKVKKLERELENRS